MKRVKTLFRRTGLLAAAFALMVQAFAVVAPVSAASGTATWTGAAGDHKFSTAGNWAGNTVPVAGNTLVFNTAPAGSGDEAINNDISAVFGGLTMSATTGGGRYFVLSSDLSLEAGAVVQSSSGNDNGAKIGFESGKGIVGQGNLIVSYESISYSVPFIKSISGALTYRGSIVLNYDTAPSGVSSFVLENGAALCNIASIGSGNTLSKPITLGGSGGSGNLYTKPCGYGGVGEEDPAESFTITTVNLGADSYIGVYGNDTVTVTNLTANGHTLTRPNAYADGTLVLPTGTQSTTYTEKTTQLDGDQASTSVTVSPKETAYLNGKRSVVDVHKDGILKGNGTANNINVSGTIAPGNSPGKITVTTYFSLDTTGVYQAEILNKDSYDQIVAGDVSLNGALSLSFLPGGSVTQGDTFTIISNTGTNPVSGAFSNLVQGAQITVSGATFSINYNGGDGNDVVLTAINTTKAPGVPNTGFFAPTLANPVVIALLGLGSLIALLIVRKQVRR